MRLNNSSKIFNRKIYVCIGLLAGVIILLLILVALYNMQHTIWLTHPSADDAKVAHEVWQELNTEVISRFDTDAIDKIDVYASATRHHAIKVMIYGIEEPDDQDYFIETVSRMIAKHTEHEALIVFFTSQQWADQDNDRIKVRDKPKVKLLREVSIADSSSAS